MPARCRDGIGAETAGSPVLWGAHPRGCHHMNTRIRKAQQVAVWLVSIHLAKMYIAMGWGKFNAAGLWTVRLPTTDGRTAAGSCAG